LARRKLGREFQARTLEPTALVHEAYLKMIGSQSIDAADRAHLLAIASRAMRQVLIDRARRRNAAKRADGIQVTLTDAGAPDGLSAEELLSLDDALTTLDPRQRQIVECRFFGGMTDEEIATSLGITDRTVRREWAKARAKLNRTLYG
jgi:RNA polymerase sigma factor (TIGR02999 family)